MVLTFLLMLYTNLGNTFQDPPCPGGIPESHIASTLSFNYSYGTNLVERPSCTTPIVFTNPCQNTNANSCTISPKCPVPETCEYYILSKIAATPIVSQKQVLRNDLVNIYIDKANILDAIATIGASEGQEYLRTKTLSQISDKQYVAAQSTISQLSSSEAENLYFVAYSNALISYQENSLTSQQKQALYVIADTKTTIAASAKSILHIVDKVNFPYEIEEVQASLHEGGIIENETAVKTKMVISPNPVDDIFNITFENLNTSDSYFLEIYDLRGILIENSFINNSSTKVELNSKNWAQGLYLIRMSSNGTNFESKLINVIH